MTGGNERGTLSKEHIIKCGFSHTGNLSLSRQFRYWKRKNKVLAFPLSDLVRADNATERKIMT